MRPSCSCFMTNEFKLAERHACRDKSCLLNGTFSFTKQDKSHEEKLSLRHTPFMSLQHIPLFHVPVAYVTDATYCVTQATECPSNNNKKLTRNMHG